MNQMAFLSVEERRSQDSTMATMSVLANHDRTVSCDLPDPGFATDLLDVAIVSREDVGEGVIALSLAFPDGASLPPFEPGAHVDVHIGTKLVRQYSLCGDPGDTDVYRLGIKLEATSRGGSAAIHRAFNAGTGIRISRPRNSFPLVASATKTFLVAGGIGVTPLMAMAAHLDGAGADFDFHYCARSRQAAPFLGELETSRYAERVHAHLDDARIFNIARDTPVPVAGAHLYVCGPGPFIDAVIEAARQKGWPFGQLHFEKFSAAPEAGGDGFEVTAARSGITVMIDAGQTIAEGLLAAGVDVALSCEQGICGTCLVKVCEGIPDHCDTYQTDDEMASNDRIAICCSRAKSSRLVLDV
jgi:ferredoxin-NADP reductase